MTRVALVTYSTKPRGGVVHTLHLAEALHRLGQRVHVFTLGEAGSGFYRRVDVPHTVLPAEPFDGPLEERVFRAVDALTEGLRGAVSDDYDLMHVQDCIAATAALRLKEESGLDIPVVRTVHHVDDFTTPALVECQRRSILGPDHILVVSRFWRRALKEEYGVEAMVVTNGVDPGRFRRPPEASLDGLRARVGAKDRFLFLTVGGIEPRKGSLELMEAMATLRATVSPPPVLVVVGGHSFQDHRPYREAVLSRARETGVDRNDLVILGTVSDEELPRWYWVSDAFVFPSIKEGFGLVVLEAMAAGLPVVATDIPVFREYLTDGRGAVLVPPGDPAALAAAMRRLVRDGHFSEQLAESGPELAGRFSWEASARRHAAIYDGVARLSRRRRSTAASA